MNWNKYLNENRLRKSTKPEDSRNAFESDYGRVLFSPAVRRMHDKTQVFPLTSDDNIHSRLTHSLEVMSIGHSLGIKILKDENFIRLTSKTQNDLEREIPIILQCSCLVHDIGNPPFGHFGETVIQQYFTKLFTEDQFNLSDFEREDFTLFDGNAQGFRVLTKLQVLDDTYGLNLTYATLASYVKYPNTGVINNNLNQKKRGVFQSEKGYLQTIAENCDLIYANNIIRHPLAFLMEAADSICYLVMDIEDGYNNGIFNYEFIKSSLYKIYGMEEIFKNIEDKYIGENTRVVNLRISLIRYLVDLAVNNFLKNIDKISTGHYNQELIKDDEHEVAKELGKFCVKYIFSEKSIRSLELTGHSVLSGLLDYYIRFIFHENKDYQQRAIGLISKSIVKIACLENKVDNFDDLSNYYKFRVIVDFISGMTDQYALNHFQKLSGQKIN